MEVKNIEVSAFRDVKISQYQKGMIGVKTSISLDEEDVARDIYKQVQEGLWAEVEAFATKIENEVTK